MGGLNVDPFEHFGEQQIASLFWIALEHYGGDEVDEEARDGVGVTHQIKSETDHFFLQVTVEGNNNVLSV